jgi:hypothetical protein
MAAGIPVASTAVSGPRGTSRIAAPDFGNAPTSREFGSQGRRLTAKTAQNGAGETVPVPAAWVYDTNNLCIPGFETQFASNSYIRLEFNGDQLAEYVRAPDSTNVWLKELQVF